MLTMTLGLLPADAAGVTSTSDRHALEASGTGAPRHCTSGKQQRYFCPSSKNVFEKYSGGRVASGSAREEPFRSEPL
ncbi:MAG: hypothetical protein ACRDZ4_01675, partial [Egibacteraceae bacterium]